MKKLGYSIFILVFLLLLITQILNIQRIGDNLVSYDPYYHNKLTDYTIDYQKIITEIPDSAVSNKVMYTTLLYPFSAVLSLVTNISTFNLYRIMGLFLLILLGLFIFITSKRISNKTFIPYLVLILFFSINYLLIRASMGIPENCAILFLVTFLFLLIIKARIEIFIIFVISYAFYHYRSLIILILLIFIFLILNYKKFKNKSIYTKSLIILPTIFLFCLPIIIEMFHSYAFLVLEYLHLTPSWNTIAPNPALYDIFSLNDFISYFNPLFLVLFPLSVLFFIKKYFNKSKEFYLLLIISLILICALFSNYVGANIPAYRFVMYLSIFLSLFIVSGMSYFFNFNKRAIKVFFILCLFLLFFLNLLIPHGWSGFSYADESALGFIQQENLENHIKISYGAPYYVFFNNSEWDQLFPLEIYKSSNKSFLLNQLNVRYGEGKDILLIISYSGFNLLKQNNPSFFEFMEEYEVYNKENVIIYEVHT